MKTAMHKIIDRVKCKLGFHDWISLDYSGYCSILECRKCKKIYTFKHKAYRDNK